MSLGPMISTLLPALTGVSPECAGAVRPQIIRARNRKYCCVCAKRKTYWVAILDPQNIGVTSIIPGFGIAKVKGPFSKRRFCWLCMPDAVRAELRDGY